jgi:hypothetical protein
VVDGCNPVRAGQRGALGVGDGHDRHVAELAVQRLQVGDVEATVEGRQLRHRRSPRQRKVLVVHVKVDRVEFTGALRNVFQHQDVMRRLVDAVLVEPERTPAAGDEVRLRLRVSARKQRHVVSLPDELLRQVRDDALGAAVVLGRHALEQGRDLGNAHRGPMRAWGR